MLYSVPYKTKQFFIVLIKLSIVIGAFYFIYQKLVENENLKLSTFLSFLSENDTFSTKNIVILVFLSIVNWFFEVLKWKTLVQSMQAISFKSALEQSLGGLTASLMTPNRIGDYGAKAIYFAAPKRKMIVLLNLIGNISQMLITCMLGLIGLLIFVNRYKIEVDHYLLTKFFIILIIVGLFAVFGIKQKAFRIKGFSLKALLKHLKQVSYKVQGCVLLLSIIRYLIFSFQFYYLLSQFGAGLDYFEAMIIISSMYFLASIVPAISIFDVVIKGSVAVFLFQIAQVNELTVLSIISIMWFLNFAIPSLFGSYFVLNFKLPKIDV